MDSNRETKELTAAACATPLFSTRLFVAPRHGFEPRFTAPKAAVLPLDDRGKAERQRTYPSLTHRDTIRSKAHLDASFRKPILAGAGPGLQTRRALLCIAGGFDPHWLPPQLAAVCPPNAVPRSIPARWKS